MSEGLNPRQERFIQEYLLDCNGRQAAIRAGYSSNGAAVQAGRLLTNPNVRAKVAAARAERAAEVKITQAQVLRMLLDTYKAATDANQHQAAVKAAELLGRHLAMFTDKVRLEPGRELTDEQLVAELAGGNAELAAMLLTLLGRANENPSMN